MSILRIDKLHKEYNSSGKSLRVLQDINFEIEEGATVSIVGSSGSGKTTLLGLCAGLDRASSGTVELCGQTLNSLNEDQRAEIRNQYVGFIFQNFQLIPTLSALENIMIPMELHGKSGAKNVAMNLLERVGLADRHHHYPSQLSGGEQQRVSLARAFSNEPRILFADEPTGNLDDDTSGTIEKLMFDLNREQGTTLVIVTHDLELARQTQRIIRLKGGHIISDEKTGQTQQSIVDEQV